MKIEAAMNLYQVAAATTKPGISTDERNGLEGKPVKGEDRGTNTISPPAGIDQAVRDINTYLQKVQRNLEFSVDKETNRVVVKVIDAESGEVVRQIPAESVLAMARDLRKEKGLLFAQRA